MTKYNNFLVDNNRREWLFALLIAALGLVVIFATPPGPVWHDAPFLAPGSLLLRLALVLVWLLISYGLGAFLLCRIIGDQVREAPVSFVYFSGFLGLTILVFALSLVSLYKREVVLAVVVVMSFAVSRWQLDLVSRCIRSTMQGIRVCVASSIVCKVEAACLLAAIIVTALFIVLFKVLFPEYGADVFYYFQYYQLAIEQSSIIPSVYDLLIYYPAKASGLHSICAVLSGEETLQVASSVYYVFFCCVCMSLMSLLTRERIWGVLLVVVSSFTVEMVVFTNNFSKTNLFGSYHPFFLVYVLLYMARGGADRLLNAMVVMYAFSAAFFTVQNVVFSLILLPAVAWPLMRSQVKIGKTLFLSASSLAGFGLFIGAMNVLLVGFFDTSTVPWQLRMGLDFAREYASCQVKFKVLEIGLMPAGPSGILLYLKHAWELISSTGFLGTRFFDLAWVGLLGAFVLPRVPNEKDCPRAFFVTFLLVLVSSFILYVMVFAIFPEEYNRRHSIFMFGLLYKAVLYVVSLLLVSRGIIPYFERRLDLDENAVKYLQIALKSIALVSVLTTSINGLPYNAKDDLRERMDFARGKTLPKTVILQYYPELVATDAALTFLEGNSLQGRIWPLGYSSPSYGYTHGRFASQIDPELQRHLRDIFYSPAEQAAKAMKRQGIPFIILDLNESMRYLSMAPVFSPESLAKNFRVLARVTDSAWLLGVAPEMGRAPDSDFINLYERYVATKAGAAEVALYKSLGVYLDKCEAIK